jgi:hypothetical protein
MRKKLIIFAVLLIVIALLVGRHLHFGFRSSRTSDEACFEIKRPYYPLRHWSWSGIFPLEGGYIPDPHFGCSEAESLPDSLSRSLGGKGTFQVVDVNQAFDDKSSEIVLLIQMCGSTHEYALQFPKDRKVQAVIATPDVPAHIFPYKDRLALLADFEGAKGIYLISLPLRSGSKLALITVSNPEFDRISRELKNAARDVRVRDQFCESRKWPFISFYEKYAGPCGNWVDNEGATAASRFAEFWKSTD